MPRSLSLPLVLATLTVAAVSLQPAVRAQNVSLAEPDSPAGAYSQSQAAPIQRSAPGTAQPQISTSTLMSGVWLRSAPGSSVQTVSSNAGSAEVRVERGIVNVMVHHPEQNSQILVDLPGGQTALTKDGLYTFNAETDTVRVLHGEADAFPTGDNDHRVKVKEEQQFVFGGGHAHDMNLAQAQTDLLPGGFAGDGRSSYRGGYGYGPYGDGFYGDGYPYPYWAYDSPYWGWGPGWGWGYPYGWGLGLGFYGGYYGGFRGGFGGGFGGFHGGGFHGR